MSTEDVTRVDQIRLVVEAIKQADDKIDWGNGLRLEFHVEDVPLQIGRADLMLIDKTHGTLYVVEVIPGEAEAEDIGRLLGYVGWLKNNLLPGPAPIGELFGFGSWSRTAELDFVRQIKGMTLSERFSAAALCALAACPEMTGKTYRFSIELGQAN